LSSSRREILQSLSRSALVLSLENVLGLARPLWLQTAPPAPPPVEPLKPGTPLGVTYFGKNVLYHNNGDGTFTEVGDKAGVAGNGKRNQLIYVKEGEGIIRTVQFDKAKR
jgi:hypothetical protein